jgi:ubiquinone/menaquinone biosynthesis C-methylase UbiE
MKKTMFDLDIYTDINRARLKHLASLNLNLKNSTVLEVGSGVGYLTSFFENLNCEVLSTDAREENVIEHRKRFPGRKVEIMNLDAPKIKSYGQFDIVFCYGTLYHLSNPDYAIENLAKMCKKLFLLETCVNNIDNGNINLTKEFEFLEDQSLYGLGCRPGRDRILSKLKKHFEYAYITVSQPDNPDFPLKWPILKPNRSMRSIFVASRDKIDNPLLLENLPQEQFYCD